MREYEELKVGQTASISRTVTESDVLFFAGITGDFNGLHMDEIMAKDGLFGCRVVHGVFSLGLISSVIGTKLPGFGSVYLSQNTEFCAQVFIGDTITASVEIIEIIKTREGIYRLKTSCMNQHGQDVLTGEAVVKYLHYVGGEKKKESFYNKFELKRLGLKRYGKNVLISRNAVLYNPDKLEVGDNVRIDDYVTISGRVVLGDYIHIAQFCGLYGGDEGIFMDDFSGLSPRVVVYATSNDYSGESLTNPTVPDEYKTTDKSLPVFLKKHVIVGTNSVVLLGVTIGEGSSVGAMSLCSKNLEPWGVYAGCPVRYIKERSKKLLELEDRLRSPKDL